MNKSKKLGIIAGGGKIPMMLIEHCVETGREFCLLGIKDNADKELIEKANVPVTWIRIGQAGTGFKMFMDEKVGEVVMIGTIKRPSFFDLVPDFRTAAFFAKVGAKALGDDGILRAVVNEIEKDGMRVVGIHEVLSDILVKEGVLGKHKPDHQAEVDILRGIEVALELGKVDVGQGVIVQQGLVLAVEGIEGTDEMIRRSKDYKRKGAGGILVKLRKPQQDMRVDLPTIGAQTVIKAAESGLRGIVIHAENGLIVDEKEAIETANKKGMFLLGINPEEYVKEHRKEKK